MTNPVIEATGDFALGSPATLIYFNGSTVTTRATIATLPQSAGQLEGSFSPSGVNAWAPTPADP